MHEMYKKYFYNPIRLCDISVSVCISPYFAREDGAFSIVSPRLCALEWKQWSEYCILFVMCMERM